MYRYKIEIWKLDSKSKERIVDLRIFDSRAEAEDFISSYKAEIKPYRIQSKTKNYYQMDGIN